MLELTPQQVRVVEKLVEHGFQVVAFPLYASRVGVCKGECAALLEPVPGGGMRVLGEAFFLVAGNPSVRVKRGGRQVFVWKKEEVPVTPERERALAEFALELSAHLLAHA